MRLNRSRQLPAYVLVLIWLAYPVSGATRDGVCLYEHGNFSGKYACVDFDVPALRRLDLNDKVSSVKLTGDVRARFHEHREYGGRSVLIEQGCASLGREAQRQILVVSDSSRRRRKGLSRLGRGDRRSTEY
ncbi:MAG: peptidase inhibitor family I36 protein [Gammaproteobacteria bacterium]|nr:peptidase inhibitor family I36 protein [Gammaproteobacteria bacterium]